MKVITIANEKGGVGKSTTTVNMAACLRKLGYRTLVIDTDPQRNTTDSYRAEVEGVATLYDVLCDEDPVSISEAIQHTEAGDIVAGDQGLKMAPKIMTDFGDFAKLRNALGEIADDYDYVIIDTQPTANILSQNALVACDEVIVPVQASRYSLQGLNDFKRSVDKIKAVNPGIRIAGLLLTKTRRNTTLNTEVSEVLPKLAEALDTKAFKTDIRLAIGVEQAQKERMSVVEFAPTSAAAQDYMAFTKEYLEG